jgi:hypothetical protein
MMLDMTKTHDEIEAGVCEGLHAFSRNTWAVGPSISGRTSFSPRLSRRSHEKKGVFRSRISYHTGMAKPHFRNGDRIRIKKGIFTGREGIVVNAVYLSEWDDPWNLTVETRSFDRCKVFLNLDGSHVEPT